MEMRVDFPSNCRTAPSQWSFAYGQSFRLIEWHNTSCLDVTAEEAKIWRESSGYNIKEATTLKALGDAYNTILAENFFNGRVPDHVHNGEILYPPGLDRDNEGSVKGFTLVLHHKLGSADMLDPDVMALMQAMGSAEEAARNQKFWTATIEDYDA